MKHSNNNNELNKLKHIAYFNISIFTSDSLSKTHTTYNVNNQNKCIESIDI